jgi:hypothetical protein
MEYEYKENIINLDGHHKKKENAKQWKEQVQ